MAKNKRKDIDGDSGGGSSENDANPLLVEQQRFLNTLSSRVRSHFFSSRHVTPVQRAEVWEKQAELGETLVNSYSWATPDPRLLKIFQHFSPIVEVGCGANAYWSKWMSASGGVDVVALDVSLEYGGKISIDQAQAHTKKKAIASNNKSHIGEGNLEIRPGGPETLSEDEELRDSGRALFLCYPDEEDYVDDNNDDNDGDEETSPPISMAAACLEHYTGSTVIHVGELYGDTLSFDQAPFGRSSSSEFSQRIATEYHCILKLRLQSNWLHVRDTISVWKRSETCCIAFQDDDDDGEDNDDSDNEVCYKYIPPDEVLPVDCAAPCVAHLLGESNSNNGAANNNANIRGKSPNTHGVYGERGINTTSAGKKRKKKEKSNEPAEAGNAW